jgi:ABC-type multidrug transport system fused ATPase/permease subunit
LPNKPKDSGVWIDKMVASWHTKEQNEPTLNNLTFSVKPGELIVIVGNKGTQKCCINN